MRAGGAFVYASNHPGLLRAVTRLDQHPAEATARWRRTEEGSQVCRPFYVEPGAVDVDA